MWGMDGKISRLQNKPLRCNRKLRTPVLACVSVRVCACIHLCESVFIYSSPSGEQRHYCAKVENLVGLSWKSHQGRFRVLRRLRHIRDINHTCDINNRVISSALLFY